MPVSALRKKILIRIKCRSRIKLAEREITRGAEDGRFKPVPLLDGDTLAAETVRELVDAGLSDDAVTLAIAYGVDLSGLACLLTMACLDATDPGLQANGQSALSLGAEARASLNRHSRDAWSELQVSPAPRPALLGGHTSEWFGKIGVENHSRCQIIPFSYVLLWQAQLAFLDEQQRTVLGKSHVPLSVHANGEARGGGGVTALQLSSVYGVATAVFLQHPSAPKLPPWLTKVLSPSRGLDKRARVFSEMRPAGALEPGYDGVVRRRRSTTEAPRREGATPDLPGLAGTMCGAAAGTPPAWPGCFFATAEWRCGGTLASVGSQLRAVGAAPGGRCEGSILTRCAAGGGTGASRRSGAGGERRGWRSAGARDGAPVQQARDKASMRPPCPFRRAPMRVGNN